jgi:hypothetical protein
MPTSSPCAITEVIAALQEIKPWSILEIGPGFGKYGFLAREYLELWGRQNYRRENWQLRIDCIEAFPSYITPCHNYIYNSIYLGDALTKLDELADYNTIMLFDVLEHFSPEDGLELIKKMKEKSKNIILSTPVVWMHQKSAYNNPYEEHKSHWTNKKLEKLGFECKIVGDEADNNPQLILAIWHHEDLQKSEKVPA